jgi:hypothetical protein
VVQDRKWFHLMSHGMLSMGNDGVWNYWDYSSNKSCRIPGIVGEIFCAEICDSQKIRIFDEKRNFLLFNASEMVIERSVKCQKYFADVEPSVFRFLSHGNVVSCSPLFAGTKEAVILDVDTGFFSLIDPLVSSFISKDGSRLLGFKSFSDNKEELILRSAINFEPLFKFMISNRDQVGFATNSNKVFIKSELAYKILEKRRDESFLSGMMKIEVVVLLCTVLFLFINQRRNYKVLPMYRRSPM